MGSRKRVSAEKRKEEKKAKYFAVLKNCPTSPRKMRLVCDTVRGAEINNALNLLKFSSKEASRRVEKLLLSAISNWQSKNEKIRIEDMGLFVKDIFVDEGTSLKRLRTAPQGRGYRIKKRSNCVTLVLDSNLPGEENENENQTK